MKFKELFPVNKPLIGMVHLPPLPGYSKHPGMSKVINKALTDLRTLEKAGFDGALVENDNDQPHQIGVSPIILKAFKEIMEVVLKKAKIPVGMEIIYDMLETVKIAHIVKAKFVRLDVYVDNVETRWGKIYAPYKKINLLINELNINNLLILTDIHVKHAKMLDKKGLAESAKEAINYKSDGLIITGTWTGKPPDLKDCKIVKSVAKKVPVLIGSGLNKDNAKKLLSYSDGAIVGTSIKTGEYIDLLKAKQLKRIIELSFR